MIIPTIGRVVWFWSCAVNAEDPRAQPRTALVCYVHSSDLINVAVFTANGDVSPCVEVPLYQGEGPRPEGLHCEWMPYQKGQAAKTEISQEIFAKVETLLTKVAVLENSLLELRAYNRPGSVPPPPPPPAQSAGENSAKDGTGVG